MGGSEEKQAEVGGKMVDGTGDSAGTAGTTGIVAAAGTADTAESAGTKVVAAAVNNAGTVVAGEPKSTDGQSTPSVGL